MLFGGGDLAEIAVLSALESEVELVGIVAPGGRRHYIAGPPVLRAMPEEQAFDAVLIVAISEPQTAYDQLKVRLPKACILAPPLLLITQDSGAAP